MLGKIKAFSRTWKRKKNCSHSPQNIGSHYTDPPSNTQLSPIGPNQGIAKPSIMMSPSYQLSHSTLDTPHSVQQLNFTTTSTSTAPPHSADTQDYSGTSYRSAPASPSHRPQQNFLPGPSAALHSRNIQDEDLQGGSFTGAHNFTIVNAYMNDGGGTKKSRGAEEGQKAKGRKWKAKEKEALEKLAAKGMPGAMLDSKDRGYIPRCNEDTRRELRARIVRWGQNDEETQRLLWLSGPAGVGKSAVAQTVAEELEKGGRLGAVFFFSRPNDRSDPDVVIPTLVYQLALLHPEYRRIITKRLTADPLILTRSRRFQFKELVIDPFLILTSYQPFLIVLDGLDECRDRSAQCEFVQMISYHVRKESNLRLRWMISSRPEPHLKIAFSAEDCRMTCLEERLEVDDSEAQVDARRILAKGFTEIRKRYPDQLTEDWPAEDQVDFIAERASGHLGFASFIIRFIGDQYYDNPFGQLEVCLKFLEHTGGSADLNPLYSLDLLYTQILSDIPTNILSTTQRMLGFFTFYNDGHLPTVMLANFLGLDQAAFYSSLQRLHSVLVIPSASQAHEKPIQVYHASFSDYLKDRTRAGKFFLEEGVVHLDVAISGLKWLSYGDKKPSRRSRPELMWIPPKVSRETVQNSLCRFSFTPCWKACIRVPKDLLPALFEVLEKFDFNLDYKTWWEKETKHFAYFIQWLVLLGNPHRTLVTARDGHEVGIRLWHEDDPGTFSLPFPEDMRPFGLENLYLRLGKDNPADFSLKVDRCWGPLFG